MKLEIIKTKDGYMAQYPDGEYLMDEHGNNLFDTTIEIFQITEAKNLSWKMLIGGDHGSE